MQPFAPVVQVASTAPPSLQTRPLPLQSAGVPSQTHAAAPAAREQTFAVAAQSSLFVMVTQPFWSRPQVTSSVPDLHDVPSPAAHSFGAGGHWQAAVG